MLRKIRIFAATFCFVLITLLFLDFTGTIHAWFGWLAKIQFWPALLALNVGVVVGLVILTLLLGRVYCSVICPLGVLQDIISWFACKTEEIPLFLFSRIEVGTLWYLGCFYSGLYCWCRFLGSVDFAL